MRRARTYFLYAMPTLREMRYSIFSSVTSCLLMNAIVFAEMRGKKCIASREIGSPLFLLNPPPCSQREVKEELWRIEERLSVSIRRSLSSRQDPEAQEIKPSPVLATCAVSRTMRSPIQSARI
jgi:hypothetical protein